MTALNLAVDHSAQAQSGSEGQLRSAYSQMMRCYAANVARARIDDLEVRDADKGSEDIQYAARAVNAGYKLGHLIGADEATLARDDAQYEVVESKAMLQNRRYLDDTLAACAKLGFAR